MATSDYNSGKAAIGTGPYKLASFTLGDAVKDLQSQLREWRGGPAPAKP